MVSFYEGAKNGAKGGLVGVLLGIGLVEGLRASAKFPAPGPSTEGYSLFHTWLEPYGLEILASNDYWYYTIIATALILGAGFGAATRTGK